MCSQTPSNPATDSTPEPPGVQRQAVQEHRPDLPSLLCQPLAGVHTTGGQQGGGERAGGKGQTPSNPELFTPPIPILESGKGRNSVIGSRRS